MEKIKEKVLKETNFDNDPESPHMEVLNLYEKKVGKAIDECIKEEEFCMSNDKYDEQIIEHTNQIEMAKKIKQKLGIK